MQEPVFPHPSQPLGQDVLQNPPEEPARRFGQGLPAPGLAVLVAEGGPIAPQGFECHQRQRHEAILLAFATAHMDPHQVTVDIGDGQVQGLAQSQAQTVGGEEIDLITEFACATDQALDLL